MIIKLLFALEQIILWYDVYCLFILFIIVVVSAKAKHSVQNASSVRPCLLYIAFCLKWTRSHVINSGILMETLQQKIVTNLL